MRTHGLALLTLSLTLFLATACILPLYRSPLPTPTALVLPTLNLPSPTAIPASPTVIPATAISPTAIPSTAIPAPQAPPPNFCADGQATVLINSLKSALQTSNGSLLASLVSPVHGMDARLYRDGRVVNYDRTHAEFLFDSTFVVNWGIAPGSGLETKGSFHDTILPDLLDVFNKNYRLTCNQIQVGGTTYQAAWPYTGINFYSVYYPGTQANGNLDWHTWLLGMHYVNGKPYLYAIVQFKWEP